MCETRKFVILRYFSYQNNQLIILYIVYLINISIFNFSIYKRLIEKKVVTKLQQAVKVKVDIITCDDINIYYTVKFQDFTARYVINNLDLLFNRHRARHNKETV